MYDRSGNQKIETVSKRVNVTLPDSVFDDLEVWAEYQGRPTANLAAFLIELGVRQAKERSEFPEVKKQIPSPTAAEKTTNKRKPSQEK
ncbi:hypothetical protein H6F61_22650 [Cyanobacteria bacterium FACHB-472]|nr:hypothetical protein [Cyanobacteria bacterium FACHB-472]